MLLWDGREALVGSFNFGSYRGDSGRSVKNEISVVVTAPEAVKDLEEDFCAMFGVESLGTGMLDNGRVGRSAG